MADINITLGVKAQEAYAELNKVRRAIAAAMDSKALFPRNLGTGFSDINKEIRALGSSRMVDGALEMRNAVKKVTTQLTELSKQKVFNSLGQQFKRNESRFQGWAMSIMFFGMAMQRVLTSVWKSSQTVFGDAMHSVEGTVTGFDKLNSSMAYLQFTIGQALEPIAEFLAPIIEKIAEWVTNNEDLARTLFVVSSVLAGILFLVGFLVLGFNGVFTAAKNVGTIIAWAMDPANLIGFKKHLEELNQFLFTTGKGSVILGVGIIAGIIAALVWIYKLQETIGGWGEFFKSVARGVMRIFVLLGSAIAGVFSEVWDTIKAGWNYIINKFANDMNDLIGIVEDAINFLRALAGLDSISLGRVDFSKMELSTKEFGDSFMDTYDAMLSKYFEWEKEVLSPKKGYAEFGGILPQYTEQQMVEQATNNLAAISSQVSTAAPAQEITNHYGDVNVTVAGFDMNEVKKGYKSVVGGWNT